MTMTTICELGRGLIHTTDTLPTRPRHAFHAESPVEEDRVVPTGSRPETDAWLALLERVSQSYVQGRPGPLLLERSLDISSREMQGCPLACAANATD